MKRGILILVAVTCFMLQSAWADTTTVPSPNHETANASKLPPPSTPSTVSVINSDKQLRDVTNPDVPPANNAEKDKRSGMMLVIALVPAIMFLVFIFVVKSVLTRNNWSLGDALSESEPIKGKNGEIVKDAAGNPVMTFARSSSRFMAFIGFFAIIVWIVGLSIPTIYRFGCTGEVPDLSKVLTFLLAQAGIFAPYIANKIAAAVKS